MDHPTSKSQDRACGLLGLTHDGTYASAARALDTLFVSSDGLPADHTWRSAAKLGDAELVAGLTGDRDGRAEYAETRHDVSA